MWEGNWEAALPSLSKDSVHFLLLLQRAGSIHVTSPQTTAQVEVAKLETQLGVRLYQVGLESLITLFAVFYLDVKEDGEKGCRGRGLLCWCGWWSHCHLISGGGSQALLMESDLCSLGPVSPPLSLVPGAFYLLGIYVT